MGKHSAPDGRGGTLPESEYVGEYQPVGIPDNPDCCTPGQLEDKVSQVDTAYEGSDGKPHGVR